MTPERLEFVRARDRAKKDKDKVRRAAYSQQWFKKNRARWCAYKNNRDALKLNATPAWADQDAMRAVYEEAERLMLETGVTYHVDHIVPLQSKLVCGLHCEANLQVLTETENCSKSNLHWPDMPSAAPSRSRATRERTRKRGVATDRSVPALYGGITPTKKPGPWAPGL